MFLFDVFLMTCSVTLTSGLFLSGFVIFMDGSDFMAGLLNNVQIWGAAFSLFAFLIFEKMRERKRFLIIIYALSRILACSVVLLPVISSNKSFQLYMLAGMIIFSNVIFNVYKVGTGTWVVSLLKPEHKCGYMYLWEGSIRIAFTLVTVLMGFLLDALGKTYEGFLLVFSLAFLLTLADIVVLKNIYEPLNVLDASKKSETKKFLEPLADAEYRKILLFILLFTFALSLSSSYTNVFLLRYLNFGYGTISIVNIIKVIFMLVFSKFWTDIGIKKGSKYALVLAIMIGVVEFVLYGFLNSSTKYLLFISAIFAGVGFSGYKAAIIAYRYDIMPDINRTIYEGWFIAIQGLSSFISPFAGNILLKKLPAIDHPIFEHSNYQLLFLISAVCVASVTIIVFCLPKTGKHNA